MGVNKEGTFNYSFTNEESETQRGGMTCSRVHSNEEVGGWRLKHILSASNPT